MKYLRQSADQDWRRSIQNLLTLPVSSQSGFQSMSDRTSDMLYQTIDTAYVYYEIWNSAFVSFYVLATK